MDSAGPGRSLLAEAVGAYPTLADAVLDGAVKVSCGMGVCHQCEREVDGVVVRTCLVRRSDDRA